MQQFGTAEVARLTQISAESIRSMVRARYVSPARGPRGALRFTFQDLVLLRTARELLAARIPPRRVGAALRALRQQLPRDLPAGGLSVTAAGDRIVVHQAGEKRDVLSGQLLLALELEVDEGRLRLIDRARTPPSVTEEDEGACEAQFEAALALEDQDVEAAIAAYRACVERHAHGGARANLGRLLHLQGRIDEALAIYEASPAADADVLYNLGVALEDVARSQDAIAAYARVIELDATHADAHHNLARLYQEAGDARRALRHWNAYRKLRGS